MANRLSLLVPGVLVVLLLTSALLLRYFAKKHGLWRGEAGRPSWSNRVSEVACNHTQVAGVLAGFSITIVVLIIGFRLGRSGLTPGMFLEEAALGMFLMAFFGYVVTGILYSIVSERQGIHEYFLFSVASVMYYFSVALSFAALLPLIRLIQYEFLQVAIVFMTVGAVLGGYWAVSIPLYDLLLLRRRFLVLLFFCATLFAFNALALGAILLKIDMSASVLPWGLSVCSFLVSLVFIVCMLTFFVECLVQEERLTKLSLVLVFIVTGMVIYLSSVTVLFLTV